MTPEELLHIAHNEPVDVEPTTAIPPLHLLERTYPESRPLQIARLPVYAALHLKKANMCRIRLPGYLSLDSLRTTLAQECEKPDEYAYIHPHFFLLADDLLNNSYNVENMEESKILVERIKEARLRKTLGGIRSLDGRALNLNNMTMFEFNEVKELIVGSMRIGRRIEDVCGDE